MDENNKPSCAACDKELLNELAISVNCMHIYGKEENDWATLRTLAPVTEYESYICLECAEDAFTEITDNQNT